MPRVDTGYSDAGALDGNEKLFVVDDPAGTPVSRNTTPSAIATYIYGDINADDIDDAATTNKFATAAQLAAVDALAATYQPLDADLTALAAAGNSAVLAATTASFLVADETKLDGIEAGADVTDATNVDAAGAVMNSDTSTAAMSFVVDEDNMVSNSATKVPTQQSVKAYVDTEIAAAPVPARLQVACSDESTAITATGTKLTFRMPFAMTVTGVRASLNSACTTGTFTVDINEGGVSILSTKLTIDATEKTSTTAATAAVISDSALADDAEISIDVDNVGDSTAKGLKVTLIGTEA